MRTRAERRYEKRLRKDRARVMVRHCWAENDRALEEIMARSADNLKVCGGECCCNPRHSHHGSEIERTTRQEQRASLGGD